MSFLESIFGKKNTKLSIAKKLIFSFTIAITVAEIFFISYKVSLKNRDPETKISALEDIEQDQKSTTEPLYKQIKGITANLGAALHIKFLEEEKNTTFADSPAIQYKKNSRLDSSVQLAEQAALFFDSQEDFRKAGNYFYDAYSTASSPDERKHFGEKARFFFEKILSSDPHHTDIKIKIAMTYFDSVIPSQGLQILSEVVKKNPNHQEALFKLGMISAQSGEYKKAAALLKKVISLNPDHLQAHMLLGIALMNAGHKEEAKLQFEKVKQLDSDTVVHILVTSYLEDLK